MGVRPAALMFLVLCLGCTEDRDPIGTEGGPYTPVSEFITQPDTAAAFAVDCADFWTAARDDHGGYFSFVDQQGGPTDDTTKAVVGQSRDAYGFARAFMLTGDEAYLDHAEHALEFLVEHGWVEEYGGWLFTLDETGEPSALDEEWDPNTFKWGFVQHYALVGLAAMCEATRDETWCGWLDEGRRVLDEQMWDAEHLGYFESADLDGSSPSGKGFTTTVDAFTTHGLSLALGDDAAAHEPRAIDLADLMVEHLVGSLDDNEIGISEEFSDDWTPISWWQWTEPGHVLKTAWSLTRAHGLEPREEYLDGSIALVRDMLDKGGYDAEYGGPYASCTTTTGQCPDDHKVYWVLEQGVVAGLSLYPLVDDEALRADLLRMADGSASFYADHLVDQQFGETFNETSRDGLTLTVEEKGDLYKAGYHSVELGYFAYLYGSLHIHGSPVTLHYNFEATEQERTLAVRPLSMRPGELVIASVHLDGQPYAAFDSAALTLDLPAGTGGVFEVTFSGT